MNPLRGRWTRHYFLHTEWYVPPNLISPLNNLFSRNFELVSLAPSAFYYTHWKIFIFGILEFFHRIQNQNSMLQWVKPYFCYYFPDKNSGTICQKFLECFLNLNFVNFSKVNFKISFISQLNVICINFHFHLNFRS